MAEPTHSLPGVSGVSQLAEERPSAAPRSTDRPAGSVEESFVIGGKYRLISEIGRGGMGSVWRAEHLGWEAPVAIKLMNRDVAEQPEARARFEREVRLAAELRSPHVVQVLDHGVDESTRVPFIAMELLEGESLDARLRRKGRLSPAETLEIVSQVVRALSRAHEAGVVHRDLKPENIFLVRNDEQSLVKILDFGIAKGSRTNVTSRLTRPGRVLGTPFYMSPEQFRGTREIDQRADLWSLSAIVCECLTGRRPFEAKDIGELALLLLRNSGRPLPSTLGPVPAGFDAWFLRATHADIEQRFQSARELGQALAQVCAGSSPPVAALGPTEELPLATGDALPAAARLRSGARLRWTPARVAAVSLLAWVPIAAGAFWQYQRQRGAAERAGPAAALESTPEVTTLGLRPPPSPGSPAAATQAAEPQASASVVSPVQQQALDGAAAAALAAPASASAGPPAALAPAAASSPAEPSGAAPSGTEPASDPGAPASSEASPARPARRAGAKRSSAEPAEARSTRRKERRSRKPAKPERGAAPESELPPVDIKGRPIRMTLDSSP